MMAAITATVKAWVQRMSRLSNEKRKEVNVRVFTRTTKVLGLANHELDALTDMVREARETGHAERQMSHTEFLAIEVCDIYEPAPHSKGNH